MAQSWTAKKRQSLLKRLRNWCFDTSDQREPLTSIELHQCNERGDPMGAPLFIWYQAQGHFENVDVLGPSIMELAAEDAGNRGGHINYALTGKFGAGAVAASFPFSLYAKKEGDEDAGDLTDHAPSERPTTQGFLAQVMRHMEMRDRTFMNTMTSLIDKFGSENERMSKALETAEIRRTKMAEREEELISKKFEREQLALDNENKRRLLMEAVGTAKMLAPVVGNYFAGEKIFPEQDMTQQMLAQFFDTLPPENWRAMVAAAPPQHQMALNMLLKQHLDKKEKASGTYQGDRPLDAAPSSPQLGTGSNGKPS